MVSQDLSGRGSCQRDANQSAVCPCMSSTGRVFDSSQLKRVIQYHSNVEKNTRPRSAMSGVRDSTGSTCVCSYNVY